MVALKTLLIDDNEAFLVLAGHLLQGNSRVQVIGRGFNGYDAVRLAESLKPDLILMDLSMPGMGGLQATRLIKAQDDPHHLAPRRCRAPRAFGARGGRWLPFQAGFRQETRFGS